MQAGGRNLLLGVPFGLLLPFFVPRRLRIIRTTLLAAVAMAVVELIQGALVQGRAFDIDDVILNTAGALLGYFLLGRRISHRYYAYTDAPLPRTPRNRGTSLTPGRSGKPTGRPGAGFLRSRAPGRSTRRRPPAPGPDPGPHRGPRPGTRDRRQAGQRPSRVREDRPRRAAPPAPKAPRPLLDRLRRH
ncbi:VanZ family protein [Streptomyces californicus]